MQQLLDGEVIAELERGMRMITGLDVIRDAPASWIGLVCDDQAMAIWLLRAIIVENVAVRRGDKVLYLPASPNYQLGGEIKNVITVVAKTTHYWTEHASAKA